MFNFLSGVVVGFIINLLSWWLLSHLIVPKVGFSESISKTRIDKEPSDRCGYRYRIRIENSGIRDIIDVTITSRFIVRDLKDYPEPSSQIVLIPLLPNGDLEYKIGNMRPIRPGRRYRHFIRFYINSGLIFIDPQVFPNEIRYKARHRNLCLEDLMNLGSDTYVEIRAFGYDSFSGARKYFHSKIYRINDILEGHFEAESLKVLPISQSEIKNSN